VLQLCQEKELTVSIPGAHTESLFHGGIARHQFAQSGNPASRDPSVGPHGGTPMDDYQPLYSASRSQTRQNPNTYPSHFQHRSGGSGHFGDDSLDSPLGLNTKLSQVIA
jgi:hypothetical protein